MRNLLTSRQSYRESFEKAFRDIFNGAEDSFYQTYIQLWLYAMRHFPELSDIAASQPRKEARLPKPKTGRPMQDRVNAFAMFAEHLGFKSLKIKAQFHRVDHPGDPDVPIATRALSSTTDVSDVLVKARSNRPFKRSFRTDRKYLFLKYIIPEPEALQHEFITTFAIARDLLCSFWDITSLKGLSTEHQTMPEHVESNINMQDASQDPIQDSTIGEVLSARPASTSSHDATDNSRTNGAIDPSTSTYTASAMDVQTADLGDPTHEAIG